MQPKNATISDLNGELITTYRVIRDDVDSLINSLKKHTYSKEYFLDVRAKDPMNMDRWMLRLDLFISTGLALTECIE